MSDTVTLEAGPELDQMIAVRMGWKAIERSTFGFWWWRGPDDAPGRIAHPFVPKVSTDLTAAMKLVDRLPFKFALDNRGGDPWWAEFATEDYEQGGQATAATPELAIAKAALFALQDQEDTTP